MAMNEKTPKESSSIPLAFYPANRPFSAVSNPSNGEHPSHPPSSQGAKLRPNSASNQGYLGLHLPGSSDTCTSRFRVPGAATTLPDLPSMDNLKEESDIESTSDEEARRLKIQWVHHRLMAESEFTDMRRPVQMQRPGESPQPNVARRLSRAYQQRDKTLESIHELEQQMRYIQEALAVQQAKLAAKEKEIETLEADSKSSPHSLASATSNPNEKAPAHEAVVRAPTQKQHRKMSRDTVAPTPEFGSSATPGVVADFVIPPKERPSINPTKLEDDCRGRPLSRNSVPEESIEDSGNCQERPSVDWLKLKRLSERPNRRWAGAASTMPDLPSYEEAPENDEDADLFSMPDINEAADAWTPPLTDDDTEGGMRVCVGAYALPLTNNFEEDDELGLRSSAPNQAGTAPSLPPLTKIRQLYDDEVDPDILLTDRFEAPTQSARLGFASQPRTAVQTARRPYYRRLRGLRPAGA